MGRRDARAEPRLARGGRRRRRRGARGRRRDRARAGRDLLGRLQRGLPRPRGASLGDRPQPALDADAGRWREAGLTAGTPEEEAMSTRSDEPATERDERAAAAGGGMPGGGGTYRTLDEQAGRLSPAEERFERRRRDIGLWLAPLLFFAVLLIPFDL